MGTANLSVGPISERMVGVVSKCPQEASNRAGWREKPAGAQVLDFVETQPAKGY